METSERDKRLPTLLQFPKISLLRSYTSMFSFSHSFIAILHNKVSLRLSDYIPLTMNAEVYFVPTSSMMINMASNTFLAFFLGTVLVYASSKVLHRRGDTEEEEVETLVQKSRTNETSCNICTYFVGTYSHRADMFVHCDDDTAVDESRVRRRCG